MSLTHSDYKTQAANGATGWKPSAPKSDLISHTEVVSDTPVMKVQRIHLTEKGKKMLTADITGPLPGVPANEAWRQRALDQEPSKIQQLLDYGSAHSRKTLERMQAPVLDTLEPQTRSSIKRFAYIYVALGVGLGISIMSLIDAIGKIVAGS